MKMECSSRTHEVLLRIENLIGTKKQDNCFDLISEHIFRDQNARKSTRKNRQQQICELSQIEQFQLVVEFCEFYERPGEDMIRNALFLSLFDGSNVCRMNVLTKLIGTAIVTRSVPILQSAGTWIQQLGPTNASCLELTQRLIEDFIVFSNNGTEQLKHVPAISPRFAINFVVCCAELYLNDTKSHQLLPPPPPLLLEIIANWMVEYPALYTETLPELVLPKGAISMPIISPIPGLIRWCVLAPISEILTAQQQTEYSKLHLAILKCLMQESSKSTNDLKPASSINPIALGVTIFALKFRATEIAKLEDRDAETKMQLSLDRLGQCIQIALHSGSLTGNVSQMMSRLKTLPGNGLLNIVIKSFCR